MLLDAADLQAHAVQLVEGARLVLGAFGRGGLDELFLQLALVGELLDPVFFLEGVLDDRVVDLGRDRIAVAGAGDEGCLPTKGDW